MATKFASSANLKTLLTGVWGWITTLKNSILDAAGKVKADILPAATSTTFGAVKTGSGIKNTAGVISVDTSSIKLEASQVDIADASGSAKGLVQIGSGINVADGVISVPAATFAGLADKPTKLSQFTNDSGFQTATQVATAVSDEVAKIVDGAPETFDTLKEVADYIEGHKSVEEALNAAIGAKADKTTVETLTTTVNGKAAKATTLAGYGITDAKIAAGTITLGGSTITPLVAADFVAFTDAEIEAIIAEVEAA